MKNIAQLRSVLFIFGFIFLSSCELNESSGDVSDFFIKYYGGTQSDFSVDIIDNPRGGFYILGESISEDFLTRNYGGLISQWQNEIILIDIDEHGNQRRVILLTDSIFHNGNNAPLDRNAAASEVLIDDEGNILVLGHIPITHSVNETSVDHFQILVTKLSGVTQAIIWKKLYGDTLNHQGSVLEYADELSSSMKLLPDGYLVVGTTNKSDLQKTGSVPVTNPSFADFSDILLIKLDFDGNVVWETKIGFRGNDEGRDAFVDNDGSIVVIGKSRRITNSDDQGADVYVAKLDEGGAPINDYSSEYLGDEDPIKIIRADDSLSFIVIGNIGVELSIADIYQNEVDERYGFFLRLNNSLVERKYSVIGNEEENLFVNNLFDIVQLPDATFTLCGVSIASGVNTLSDPQLMYINISRLGDVDYGSIHTVGGRGIDVAVSMIPQPQSNRIHTAAIVDFDGSSTMISLIKSDLYGRVN